jgi:polar amino acid transport system ATP-binding protein
LTLAPLLAAAGLCKSFNGVPAVQDVCLEVEKGAFVSIIGPSGCGKTTLLRCLNFLDFADQGSVTLGALRVECGGKRTRAMERDAHRLRAGIGMVFQGFHLFAHRSVIDNILLAPRVVKHVAAGQARAEAEALLAKVGLLDYANRMPATLSGGQQQRAAIARALAMRPQVMLYDEPTSALDPELKQEVLQVMRDLNADGMTQILVTHEMTFAQTASDSVIYMQDGRIVERAPPAHLFAQADDPRTRRFLARVQ